MTFEQMSKIHEEILKSTDFTTIKYTKICAEQSYLTEEQKIFKDSSRTIEHNSLINNLIVLERVFKMYSSKNDTWTMQLILQEGMQNITTKEVSVHRQRL